MPSDIRSYFGGKPAGSPAAKAKPKEEPKKRGRPRKVIEDDDDDDEPARKKATPKKSAPKKEPEPKLEETTADDYFGKGKPKRSGVTQSKNTSKEMPASTPKKVETKMNGTKAPPNCRGSARARKTKSYDDLDFNDFRDEDLEDDGDDEFKANAKIGKRMDAGYEEGTDDEDDMPVVSNKRANRKRKKADERAPNAQNSDSDVDMTDTNREDKFAVPDDEQEIIEAKPAKKTPSKSTRKRKSIALYDDEDDDLGIEEAKTKKPASPAKKSAPVAKKTKKDTLQDSAEIKSIFDSITMIDPPPPPKKSVGDDEKPKFQYGQQHANSAAPAGAIADSDIPIGQENCLAGLTFVFTGQLQTLGREKGQALVKQYGGKVTSAPSSKTNFVVLGEEAGPKKLETIKKYSLKVINEEGLFQLIQRLPANGGDGAAAEKYAEKMAKEEEQVRQQAAEIDRQEKEAKAKQGIVAAANSKQNPQMRASKTPAAQSSTAMSAEKGRASVEGADSRLWTVRYAPQSISQICGNKTTVEKLQRWLRLFPKNQRTNFKMPGPDGSGVHRAVMIHGPPGIGKTTAAHLLAKMEGYDIVESNASDTRSKKLVENGLKGVLSTTSLMGYFGKGSEEAEASKKKLVLIMDEVDGMSAGDRGGVGALAAVCKKTQIPMILICNERKQPKMKPFDFVTFDLPFRRPTVDQIRSRIMTIAFREGLKMPANVINALIEGTGADIRQVVNMISTAKLDSRNLSFEESKDMTKAWEKHIILKPWDMVGKILGGGLFNPASNSSLNDKTDLYFNDHEFAPLMLQENYLGTNPARSLRYKGEPKMKNFSDLDLVSKAADSISDGDLVDRMIHGSQQQWSLMPTHAIFSFVRPASFVHGSMAGHQTRFASWLGNNSKLSKLVRFVKEIQGHMRLRVSADRHEIRQTYLPILYEKLIKKLETEGKEAVPEIIELMDSYYLTKDDWDAILELGVGKADMENIKIETQAKATFTRLYNQQSHPLPFMKASQVVAPKKAPAKDKPDLEEAFEESADEAIEDEETKEDDDGDLAKDKYVKQPKKKRAPAKAGASKKRKQAVDDDDDEAQEEKGKKKGKGRVKK